MALNAKFYMFLANVSLFTSRRKARGLEHLTVVENQSQHIQEEHNGSQRGKEEK